MKPKVRESRGLKSGEKVASKDNHRCNKEKYTKT